MRGFLAVGCVVRGQLVDITPVETKSDDQEPTVLLHFIVEQRFRRADGDRRVIQIRGRCSWRILRRECDDEDRCDGARETLELHATSWPKLETASNYGR